MHFGHSGGFGPIPYLIFTSLLCPSKMFGLKGQVAFTPVLTPLS